jgi:hypothetical protein
MKSKIIPIVSAVFLLAFTLYLYTRTPEPIQLDVRPIDSAFIQKDSAMMVRIKKVERRVKRLENGK